MELICDVIIKDRRTGIEVNRANSVASAKILELDAAGNVIYRFNFEFSTAVDKRIVDQIDQLPDRSGER